MRLRVSLLVLAAASLACKGKKSDADELKDGNPAPTSKTAQVVPAPDGSYNVELPARWYKLFRVDSLSSAERGTARPGALNFVYLPKDATQLPQTLMVIAVYDSIAWQKLKAEGGPPPGDSTRSQNGRVFVLSLPQSNPFTAGSADALKFDSLALTPVEKSRLVQLRAAIVK